MKYLIVNTASSFLQKYTWQQGKGVTAFLSAYFI